MSTTTRPTTCMRVKSGKLYAQEVIDVWDYGDADPITGLYGRPVRLPDQVSRHWRQIREDGKGGWKWYGPSKDRLAGEEVPLPCQHEEIR